MPCFQINTTITYFFYITHVLYNIFMRFHWLSFRLLTNGILLFCFGKAEAFQMTPGNVNNMRDLSLCLRKYLFNLLI